LGHARIAAEGTAGVKALKTMQVYDFIAVLSLLGFF
jgi:hypothetical protein